MQQGQVIGRYQIETRIGAGGMGAVYRVRHVILGSHHAIKVLHTQTPEMTERLLREAKAQAQLAHPNILRVTDFLEVDGLHVIVMEYVEGPTLHQLLQHRHLTLDEVSMLGQGIVQGVLAAHKVNLIHRDLKPANVLIATINGQMVPKVADFGLVKDTDATQQLTRTGLCMGTPGYAAPEQIRGSNSIDARADVFALGATLYEVATSTRAFSGADLLEILNATSKGQYSDPRALRPDLPEQMVSAIQGALKANRSERLSCQELLSTWTGRSASREVSSSGMAPEHPPMEVLAAGDDDPAIAQHLANCVKCRIDLRIFRQHFPAPTAENPAPRSEPQRTYYDSAVSPPSLYAPQQHATPKHDTPTRWRWLGVAVCLGLLLGGGLWWNTHLPEATVAVETRPSFLIFESDDQDAVQRFQSATEAFHQAQFPLAARLLEPIVRDHPDQPSPLILQVIVRDFLGIGTAEVINTMDHVRSMPDTDHPCAQFATLVFDALHCPASENVGIAIEQFAQWAAGQQADYDLLVVTNMFFEKVPVPELVADQIGTAARHQKLKRYSELPLTHVLLARHAMQGDDDVAMQEALAAGIAVASDPAYFLFLQGQQFKNQGLLEQARGAFVDVLKHDPAMSMAREALVNVLLQLGEEDQRQEQVVIMLSETASPVAKASFCHSHSSELILYGRLDAAVELLRLRTEILLDKEEYLDAAISQMEIADAAQILEDTEQYRTATAQLTEYLSAPELAQESRQGLSTSLFAMESIDDAKHGDISQAQSSLARLLKMPEEDFTFVAKPAVLIKVQVHLHWAEQNWAEALKIKAKLDESTPDTRCKNQSAGLFISDALAHTQGTQAAIDWLSQPLPDDCSPHPYQPLQLSRRAVMELQTGQADAARDTIQAFERLWPHPDPDLPAVVAIQQVRSQLASVP